MRGHCLSKAEFFRIQLRDWHVFHSQLLCKFVIFQSRLLLIPCTFWSESSMTWREESNNGSNLGTKKRCEERTFLDNNRRVCNDVLRRCYEREATFSLQHEFSTQRCRRKKHNERRIICLLFTFRSLWTTLLFFALLYLKQLILRLVPLLFRFPSGFSPYLFLISESRVSFFPFVWLHLNERKEEEEEEGEMRMKKVIEPVKGRDRFPPAFRVQRK